MPAGGCDGTRGSGGHRAKCGWRPVGPRTTGCSPGPLVPRSDALKRPDARRHSAPSCRPRPRRTPTPGSRRSRAAGSDRQVSPAAFAPPHRDHPTPGRSRSATASGGEEPSRRPCTDRGSSPCGPQQLSTSCPTTSNAKRSTVTDTPSASYGTAVHVEVGARRGSTGDRRRLRAAPPAPRRRGCTSPGRLAVARVTPASL
jgi:hypothetical protein